MDITIATLNDIEDVRNLLFEQHLYHYILQERVFDRIEKHTLIPDQWLMEVIGSESTCFAICRSENEAVGLIMFSEKSTDNPSYHEKKWIYIEEIIVLSSSRGTGIGKALIKYVEEHAIEKQINIIKLDVWSNNQPAINFYTQNEFMKKKTELWKTLDGTEI